MRPVVIQCIILALCTMVVLIRYILLATSLNAEFASHRNLLVLNAMRCESELAELLTSETDSSVGQNKNGTVQTAENNLSTKGVVVDAAPLVYASKDKLIPTNKLSVDTRHKGGVEEGHWNTRVSGMLSFSDFDSVSREDSRSLTQYQQLALSRMGSRFNIGGGDNSVIFSGNLQLSSPVIAKPTTMDTGVRNMPHSQAFTPQAVPAPFVVTNSHLPDNTVKIRLKIFELEESVKAMRRAVDAIDISNREYTARVRTPFNIVNCLLSLNVLPS
jgi:hypothetical protein